MGYMTTVTFLNDMHDQIEKYPEQFLEAIKKGMHGIDYMGTRGNRISSYGCGNYANGLMVGQSHHADDPRLYMIHQNAMHGFGYGSDLNDERFIPYRKQMVKLAKRLIKQEEEDIKRLEKKFEDKKWDFQIGQRVYADLEPEYGFSDDDVFIVKKREFDDENQVYTLQPEKDNGQLYEAWPSMVQAIPVTANEG